MKKKFSLQTMEMAEAAVKDAINFGLSASIEEKEGEISVAYESAVPVTKEATAVSWDDVYSVMRSVYSECEYQMKWMKEDLRWLSEAFSKHAGAGHLPQINDAGQMEKALKTLEQATKLAGRENQS